MTERLPMPDWTRAGETWRVEPEPHLRMMNGGACSHRERGRGRPVQCFRVGVAAGLPNSGLVLCARHLLEQRCWIEDGRVVSWALRP